MKKIFILFISLVGLLFSVPLISLTSHAIPISPDKYYLKINDNLPHTEKFIIYGNEQLSGAQDIYIYVLGMKKIGEENDRQFYYVDPKDDSEVANWIELEKSTLTIKKGSINEVKWTIKSKADIGCGSHLAAIVASTSASNSQNINQDKVVFKNEVISQVHIDITERNGKPCDNTNTSNNLLDFKLNSNSNIFSSPKVGLITRVENTGDYMLRSPLGFIEIFQYGRKLETISFNPTKLDIYPGTIRKFDNIYIDENYPYNGNFFEQLFYEIKNPRFGFFEAKLGITMNVKPQMISSVTFWIIPWRIIESILILLTITFITIFVIKKYSKKKKSKRML